VCQQRFGGEQFELEPGLDPETFECGLGCLGRAGDLRILKAGRLCCPRALVAQKISINNFTTSLETLNPI
jgi:hypothetical protein